MSEKYLEVFTWFESELEEVQKVYEEEKVSLVLNIIVISIHGKCQDLLIMDIKAMVMLIIMLVGCLRRTDYMVMVMRVG